MIGVSLDLDKKANEMTDEELIARLLMPGEVDDETCIAAVDRIEALVREKAAAYAQGYGDCESEISLTEIGRTNEFLHGQIAKWKARAERLEAALVEHNDLLRSALAIAKREGIEGQIASTNWDAYYSRVAAVLEHHHQTANDARAALKGEDHD